MPDRRIITTKGTALDETIVQKFKASLRGELIRPGDEGYESARRVWNWTIDRHPGMIVRCSGAADVIRAVEFARSHGLLVAVRGGGRSFSGQSVCDGGLVIDLSCMKGIEVDPVRRIARAEAGVTVGEFDQATQAFDLATPLGACPAVGIFPLVGELAINIGGCYCGDLETGEKVLKPLRSFGRPIADSIRPLPYLEMQAMATIPSLERLSCYRKNSLLRELSDEAIDVIVTNVEQAPSPACGFALVHLHGAVCQVAQEETACSFREAGYYFWADTLWQDAADVDFSLAWVRSFWEAMQPFASGAVYVNELSDEGEEWVQAAYGTNYERLVALKNTYDPTNFFRLNQNIKPTV